MTKGQRKGFERTPYSDVALVMNALCAQGMPTGPVLGLKMRR
jgi:hypothetical protein